jgi:hypothetical protein
MSFIGSSHFRGREPSEGSSCSRPRAYHAHPRYTTALRSRELYLLSSEFTGSNCARTSSMFCIAYTHRPASRDEFAFGVTLITFQRFIEALRADFQVP